MNVKAAHPVDPVGYRLNLFIPHQAGKMLERAIIGSLRIVGKATSRELPRLEMMGNTLTANSLSWTRVIAAVAALHVFLFLTFHFVTLLIICVPAPSFLHRSGDRPDVNPYPPYQQKWVLGKGLQHITAWRN
jgi:hypothetical protein